MSVRVHARGTRGGGRVRPSAVLAAVLVVAASAVPACARTPGTPPRTPGRPSGTAPPSPVSPGPATPTAAPAPAPPARARFLAFGDFGTGDAAQLAVARAMRRWAGSAPLDALVSTGDNVYPTGAPSRFRAALDAPYAPLRRSAPLWATLGNHDVVSGHGPAQLRHLHLPPLPYARRLPGAELLFLDANHVDAAQARWLRARLAAPGPPLRVVVFHQPAWSCSTHGSTPAVDRLWVPILERYRVALVLNGHDHNYQRYTSRRGVTYVVTGGGGAGLYPVRAGCGGLPRRAAASRHHFVAVTVDGATMSVTAVAADGTVLDRAILTR